MQRPRPIFIIGSYRSGTSVTTWCLGQHSNIWVLPETYWLAEFASLMPRLYSMGSVHAAAHFSRCGLTEDDFRAAAADFVEQVVRLGQTRRSARIAHGAAHGGREPPHMRLRRADSEPKTRWVDGTPENAHYVPALLTLFPDARFIHLVRSPHEVVRSLASFDRAGGQAQTVPEAYATWKRLASASYQAELDFGRDVVRRFFYADLVGNPEKTLTEMLAFVGEMFEPACIEPLSQRINSSQVSSDPLLDPETAPKNVRALVVENEEYFQLLRSPQNEPFSSDAREAGR